jgi:hypothetical protein
VIQPPEMGSVVALPLVGGLHHRYERRAAGKSQKRPGGALSILGALKSLSELCASAQTRIDKFRSPDLSRAANRSTFAVRLEE